MKRKKSVLGLVGCITRLAFEGGLLLALLLTFSSQALAQGGTWATKAPMPTPRQYLLGGTSVVNGVVYAVGGFGGAGYLSTVEAYDPATDTWTTKAPMPTPRGLLGTSVVNGIIYAVGGANYASFSRTVEAYDPATDTWTTKTSMPTARYGLSTSVVNGVLYAMGGYDNSGVLGTIEAYDPASDTWTTKNPMPTPRLVHGTSVVNGIIYAVGGFNASYLLVGPVEAYDPASETWTTKASIPTPRGGLSTSVVNGVIFAAGGNDNVGFLVTVEAYDPASDTWTTKASMPTARYLLGTSVVNGILYAVGGAGPGGRVFATVEAFTPTNQPPVANAGPDQTPECSNPAGTLVTLNGSATDPDGDSLTYTWTGLFAEGGGTVTGASPAVTLPLGTWTVTLVVNDGTVNSAPDTVKIDIQVFVSGLQPPMVGLSPEAVPPLLPTKAFKRGSTIPLKLQLFCSGIVCTNAAMPPPRIVGLFASGEEIDLETVDINSGASNDNGVLFRFSDLSWVYNLSTQGLSAGTYTITIEMPDGRRFNAGFVLK